MSFVQADHLAYQMRERCDLKAEGKQNSDILLILVVVTSISVFFFKLCAKGALVKRKYRRW